MSRRIRHNLRRPFVRGVIAGAVVTALVARIREQAMNAQFDLELRTAKDKSHLDGFAGGWEGAKANYAPYINHDFYEKMYKQPFLG
jgi:uncharacterized membrane-anchored protein YhcB (DUF1043 family)